MLLLLLHLLLLLLLHLLLLLLLHLLLLILLHSLLLHFFGNRCIVNDHSYAATIVAIVAIVAIVVAVISRRAAVPTAFSAGSLFIVLFVSRGVHGDNAESVAQVGRVRVKCVFARCTRHLVAVFFLEGFNHILVNERRNVKEILNVGFDDVHHVLGIHALRTHERELNLDLLVDLLELQGAESVRLGALAQLKIGVDGLDDPDKNAAHTQNDVHVGVADVNAGGEPNRG